MKKLQVYLLPFIAVLILVVVIFFIPPENIYVVGIALLLTSFITYSLARILLRRSISITVAVFILLLLVFKMIGELTPINVVLLLSLLTTVLILVK